MNITNKRFQPFVFSLGTGVSNNGQTVEDPAVSFFHHDYCKIEHTRVAKCSDDFILLVKGALFLR